MRQAGCTGLGVLAALLCLAGATAPGAGGADGKVSVEGISYERLGKLVRGLRGKVVVVSFWAQY
jgi:hypothetical protein